MNMFVDIFAALNKARIKYLVVGGVAVNLYGFIRYTGDIDILLELDEKNLLKMDKLMEEMGYIARIPVQIQELRDIKKLQQWIEEKGMKAYTYLNNKRMSPDIDILVEDSMKFKKHSKEKKVMRAWNIHVPVISYEYLIKMKERANREDDRRDLRALMAIKNMNDQKYNF